MIGLFKMPFHVDLPIKVKGNSKCSSSNSFSPLGRQNKDIGAALQTLLTEVKLRLRRMLLVWWCKRGQPCLHQLHVQGFRCGHSLRVAFRLCFSLLPFLPFYFPLIYQYDRCLVPVALGLIAGRRRFTSHGRLTFTRSLTIGFHSWVTNTTINFGYSCFHERMQ